MSYIKTSTVDDLGRRPLSYYERAKFPLPTTGMSRVIRTRTMGWDTQLGWDNAPYGSYRQPELSRTRQLNGEWVPPGPPPRAMAQNNGAITYRVNPATGKYQFYSTDVLPRGVFKQNTFQHPATQTLSAFGVAMPVTGQQLVQLPSGQQILSRTAPGKHPCKSGGSCKCHGKCKRSRSMSGLRGLFGLGDDGDISIDPNTGGQVDSDGNLLTLPCGPGGQQLPTSQCPKNTSVLPGASDPGLVQQLTSVTPQQNTSVISQAVQAISAFGPQQTPVVVTQQPSWFNQSTIIGGTAVSNGTLAMGAGLAAIVISGMGGKKRR
jgi:hypothetical protein